MHGHGCGIEGRHAGRHGRMGRVLLGAAHVAQVGIGHVDT